MSLIDDKREFLLGEEVIIIRKLTITDEEIQQCINLLDEKYHSGYKLKVITTKLQFIFWYIITGRKLESMKYLYEVLTCKSRGCYFTNSKIINIYEFNYKNIPDRFFKQTIIFDIFHEIRHYYQDTYMRYKFNNNFNNYIRVDKVGYGSQPIERDANKFAGRMCKKHKDKISDILNIYSDWWSYYYK